MRENMYSHSIPISIFLFQISNFNIIGVYRQHSLSVFHQLPISSSKVKNSKVKKSPTDTGSQEEGELDLKGDFGKPEHVDNFLMSL